MSDETHRIEQENGSRMEGQCSSGDITRGTIRGGVLIDLRAGPELDAQIAAACGHENRISTGGSCEIVSPYSPSMSKCWEEFAPSEDTDDAFQAAEKSRLFDDGTFYLLKLDEVWSVAFLDNSDWHSPLGQGSTPALAICAAILAYANR